MKELEESKLRFFITTFAARVHKTARQYNRFHLSYIRSEGLSLFRVCHLLNKDSNYSYYGNYNYCSHYKNPYDKIIDRDEVIKYTHTVINSNPSGILQVLNKLFESEDGVKTAEISIHSKGSIADFDLYLSRFEINILGDINNSKIIQYMMNEANTVKYSSAKSETVDWDEF
jgi:hypothetical protein